MKKKILVVDDETTLTKMIKLNLERTGTVEVCTENDSRNAVNTIRSFEPDMIFLDVMMPGVSGDDIAQQLRQDKQLADIPIVFMTAIISKEETASLGSVIGGNRFLAKPVKTEELLEVISEVLD
jgi:CheY-like chemotaxis protein